jgi:prepilin-type N-terminal cleavage/methylation domain-containing protein
MSKANKDVMQDFNRENDTGPNPESGFTLVEMVIAALILLVGMTAGMALIIMAMANDNRSKNDSSATILSQMTIETIAAVPANATTSMTLVDCNPTSSSASHSINTTGSSGGAGAPLTGGIIDFSQATVTGYAMTYYACQASTGDRQTLYDVRWNIQTLSPDAKLVTVAAKPIASSSNSNFLAVPVTLKMTVGL